MSIFEEIGQRITDAGQGVVQQTKNLSDATRLNNLISEKKKKATKLFSILGQDYYQKHRYDPNADGQEQIRQLNVLLSELAAHKRELNQIKGVGVCPACGTEVTGETAYCPKCGTRVEVPTPPKPAPQLGICPACGARNVPNSTFCMHCGNQLPHPVRINNPPQYGKKPMLNSKTIGIIAVSAAVVLVLVLGILLFGGRSYNTVVKQYIKASFTEDSGKDIIKLLPKAFLEEMYDETGMDREDAIDEINDSMGSALERLEDMYGSDWKYTYEIKDTDDIKRDDLEDIQDEYDDICNLSVSEAKKIEVEVTVEGGDNEVSTTMYVYVVKIGRNWYLDATSMY